VEDVCAPPKSITANNLPAGVAVRAFDSHTKGPGSNPAQDKNFHLWLEWLCCIACKAFYSGDPYCDSRTLVNSPISSVQLVAFACSFNWPVDSFWASIIFSTTSSLIYSEVVHLATQWGVGGSIVYAPPKSITANDLPVGVAVRAFDSHVVGPGSNPAQDKNFDLWLPYCMQSFLQVFLSCKISCH
jgi:hypothetical protein